MLNIYFLDLRYWPPLGYFGKFVDSRPTSHVRTIGPVLALEADVHNALPWALEHRQLLSALCTRDKKLVVREFILSNWRAFLRPMY